MFLLRRRVPRGLVKHIIDYTRISAARQLSSDELAVLEGAWGLGG